MNFGEPRVPVNGERAAELLLAHRRFIKTSTDTLFAPVLVLHYLVGIGLAVWLTPRTWIGDSSHMHVHLMAAVFLNFALIFPAVLMAWYRPGQKLTRHAIVVVLMLQSALLIHLTGGRIETHFHIFAMLAVVAFYRDWQVLVTATVVVAVDHFIRGVWYPQSVYGIATASPYRWIEHAGWVVLEVAFLIYSCRRSRLEMGEIANRQARLEEEISQRHQMHETLQLHAERLRLATTAGALGLWDWHIAKEELYFSDEYYTMLGFEPGEFEPSFEAWKNLLHPDDMQRALAEVQRHLDGNTPVMSMEVRLRHKSGSWHWVRAVGEVVERIDNKPQRMVGLHIDIDQERQTREALAVARDDAQAASRAKSEFLANMSHEIRTPINGVIGTLELMEGSQLTQRQANYIKAAQTSAQSLLSLVNDILDFSKIEAQQFELAHEPFNLETMIEEAMVVLINRAQLKKLELAFSIDPSVNQSVIGDEDRLRQILVNLVNNGIKFTARGEVVVTVRVEEDTADAQLIRFEVRDTGVGIPASKRGRIFKSFSQADSSMSRKYGGTGLGLVISKQLCEMMGGSIGFESIEHLGSVFRFTARLAKQKSTTTIDRALPLHLEQQHLLIVDDNETSRQMMQELIHHWHIDAVGVGSGKDAWAMLEKRLTQQPITLALIDMVMPEEDGLALCKRIRSDARFDNVKLLLCNSQHNPPTEEELAEVGCNGIINKPIGPSRLFDTLMQMLGSGETSRHESRREVSRAAARESMEQNADVRVLIAEDNEINRMVACDLLKEEGFHVSVASNGSEAVKAVIDEPYDIILMDCQMPEMDGFEATSRIRELHDEGRICKLPVIIALTANAMRGDREMCLGKGMDDYLSKPIQRHKLIAALNRWLGERPVTAPAPAPADNHQPVVQEELATATVAQPTTSQAVSIQAQVIAPAPAEDDLDSQSIIDVPQLLQRCLNKPSLAQRVLQTFEATSSQELAALQGYFDTGDLVNARITAHKIRGGAAQISATRISQKAAELEELSIHPMEDAWRQQLEQLNSEVNQLRAMLPDVLDTLGENGATTSSRNESISAKDEATP